MGMLAVVGLQGATKVLFLANCGHGDYQCYLSLHGLRRVLSIGLVDIPKLEFMYKQHGLEAMKDLDRRTPCPQSLCTVVSGSSSQPVIQGLGAPVPVYGGGFSYAFRMDDVAVNRSDASIQSRIRKREF